MSSNIQSLRDNIQLASRKYIDANSTEKKSAPSFSQKAIQVLRELDFSPSPALSYPLKGRLSSIKSLTEKLQQAQTSKSSDCIKNLAKTILITSMVAGGIFTLVTGTGVVLGGGLLFLSLILGIVITSQSEVMDENERRKLLLISLRLPPVIVFMGIAFPLIEIFTKIPNLDKKIEKEKEGIETYNREMKHLLYVTNTCGLDHILKEKIAELESIPLGVSALPEHTKKSIQQLKESYQITLTEHVKIANYYKPKN